MRLATSSYDINPGVGSLFNTLFGTLASSGVEVHAFSREKVEASGGLYVGGLVFHHIKTPASATPELEVLKRFYFNRAFCKRLENGGYDLVHGLCFNAYPVHRSATPYVLDDIVYPDYMEFVSTDLKKLDYWVYRRTQLNMLPFTYTVRVECENAERIIVPTEYKRDKILECFDGLDRGRITVLPRVVLAAEKPETPAGEKKKGLNTILFVGNDYLVKGLHYLLEAMADVVREVPDTILLVAGAQRRQHVRSKLSVEYVKRLISEKGLGRSVFFLGELPHGRVQEYMRMCDVFCLPTLRDSCSRAVLEAVSNGKPVVTTPVAGFGDVDDVGVLVQPRDSAAIGSALARLLTDDKLRRKKESNCAKVLGKYSPGKVIPQYIKLYEEVS